MYIIHPCDVNIYTTKVTTTHTFRIYRRGRVLKHVVTSPWVYIYTHFLTVYSLLVEPLNHHPL